MKRLLSFLFFTILITISVSAQNAWTVEKVPNTRIQGDFIHVSDPDGYISAETEKRINTALSAIQDTADVFIVALNSIGFEDPQMFRTELFAHWGIGDKNKNNGMLLLFVEDQHALEFETGYGIEPVMTDVKCFEIFNHTIKPYFKNGDYDGGLYAGVLDIVEVFGGNVPTDLIETLPDEDVYNTAVAERDKETMSDFYLLTIFIMFSLPIVAGLYYLYSWANDKQARNTGIKDSYTIKDVNGVSYIYDFQNTWTGSPWQGNGCSRALTFGFSGMVWFVLCASIITVAMAGKEELYVNNWVAAAAVVVYLTWICWRHNVRTLKMANKVAKDSLNPKKVYETAKTNTTALILNAITPWIGAYYNKKYDRLKNACPDMQCPTCHRAMTKGEDVLLSEKQAFETKNNIMKYVSLHCLQGHTFVKADNGANYNKYKDCQKCGVHALKQIKVKVIERATYYKGGVDEVVYVCQFCGEEQIIRQTTPKLVRPVTTGGSYGGSSRGWSGSHSSGSFGGGRSGGGGFSGRW